MAEENTLPPEFDVHIAVNGKISAAAGNVVTGEGQFTLQKFTTSNLPSSLLPDFKSGDNVSLGLQATLKQAGHFFEVVSLHGSSCEGIRFHSKNASMDARKALDKYQVLHNKAMDRLLYTSVFGEKALQLIGKVKAAFEDPSLTCDALYIISDMEQDQKKFLDHAQYVQKHFCEGSKTISNALILEMREQGKLEKEAKELERQEAALVRRLEQLKQRRLRAEAACEEHSAGRMSKADGMAFSFGGPNVIRELQQQIFAPSSPEEATQRMQVARDQEEALSEESHDDP